MGTAADVSGGEHELPRWVVSEPVNPLDSRASQTLNQSLDGKISVTVALKELVEHRRAENRSLAARSLALIDEFDPFAALLERPRSTGRLAGRDRIVASGIGSRSGFGRQSARDVRERARQGWRRSVSAAVGL